MIELLTLCVNSHFGEWWKVEETVVVLSVSLISYIPLSALGSVCDGLRTSRPVGDRKILSRQEDYS